MNKPKAFTLVELLVVISIIAILMAVLMPALQLAKTTAQSIVCMANNRVLLTSWMLFAEDNEGMLVGGNAAYTNDSWVQPPLDINGVELTAIGGGGPIVATVDPSPAATGFTEQDEIRGIEAGALFPYSGNHEQYRCPGDKSKSLGGGYRSTSIIATLNGELPNADGYVTKINNILRPTEKIVFMPNYDNRQYNMGSWIMHAEKGNASAAAWIDPVAIWHAGVSTMSFADGHAGKRKWVDKKTKEMMDLDNPFDMPLESGDPRNDIEFLWRVYLAGNKKGIE